MAKAMADRHIFGQELCEIGKTNPNFVVCNADTKACNLEHFADLFPDRAFSIGIAEQDMTDIAAGLAACGNKVFICHPNLNVTILATHTGLQVGSDGATHAAVEDVGIMSSMPNMTIVQPADGVSARAIAHWAVDFNGPLYVRLHRNPVPDFYKPGEFTFTFGKAITAADYGKDLTIISSGILLAKAYEAAGILNSRGIGARVLDMQTIKPLDTEAVIRAAKETGAILTVEDHSILNGLGAACAETVVENCPVPMKRIGIPDCFGESGDPELLYKAHGMDTDSIVEKAMELVRRKEG